MKKINILIAIIAAGMLFTSCDSNEHEDHMNNSQMESHEGHNYSDKSAELGLNGGKKWQVNSEMIMPVREMETTINSFSIKGKGDYSELARELKVEIDQLTSSCTMTGESHDQLHLWLLPHIKLVDELSKANNDKDCSSKYEEIQASMITFNEYFQ